jgi:predicted DNA-binding mobile mystery protein A
MKQSTYHKILQNIEKKYRKLWLIHGNNPLYNSSQWIKNLRWGFGMSFRQLGKKLGITAASASELETREIEGTVTLNSLRQAANAFDMDLFYMFVPRSENLASTHPLEDMVRKRAVSVARQIVERASTTMILEEQGTSEERFEEEVLELAGKIEKEMPRYLWD